MAKRSLKKLQEAITSRANSVNATDSNLRTDSRLCVPRGALDRTVKLEPVVFHGYVYFDTGFTLSPGDAQLREVHRVRETVRENPDSHLLSPGMCSLKEMWTNK